jgi:catechol 2,3-dioxygenase-like lactoylglutathione lyase family enzyme
MEQPPRQPRPEAQITHVGIYVRDMDRMIEFYTRVLGLILTDRGPYYRGGEICFLSRKADEHHQVVFASGRGAQVPSTINQISFFVADLATLRDYHAALAAEGIAGLDPINHGNAWSLYFPDPEGNRLELYTVTPWYVQQPFADKLDLTEPVETVLAKTLAMIQGDPSHCPRDQWVARMRERLGEVRLP